MCLDTGESVFFFNFEFIVVSDSLGVRICVCSVGNVELLFQNWFTLSMPRPSSKAIHTLKVWKARVWLAVTLSFESEIRSWYITIHRVGGDLKRSNRKHRAKHSYKVFIGYNILSLHCTKAAKPGA